MTPATLQMVSAVVLTYCSIKLLQFGFCTLCHVLTAFVASLLTIVKKVETWQFVFFCHLFYVMYRVYTNPEEALYKVELYRKMYIQTQV